MFHVPESNRLLTHPILASTSADGNNGVFRLLSPEPGWDLWVIVSDGDGWEHVSVHVTRSEDSKKMRTPNWKEMCFVKDTFWDGEDEVIQFHPKKSEYVNCHPYTLHLWRPIGTEIPRPNPTMVGPVRY